VSRYAIEHIALALVYLICAIVLIVTLVGAVQAITDDAYSFRDYLADLSVLGEFVIGAAIAAVGSILKSKGKESE
jgi:hypothetical protein